MSAGVIRDVQTGRYVGWRDRTCSDCGGRKELGTAQRCRGCYLAWRRTGAMRADVSERFWSKVDLRGPDECWEWTGFRYQGWGRFTVERGRSEGAHRVAYRLAGGVIPDGMEVDHLCRNRACVNPGHLETVTGLENKRRANAGRQPATHCKHGHAFTPENTYVWPKRPDERQCIACARDRKRARRARAA